MQPKLGIIAGSGALPRHLAEVAQQSGRSVFIAAIEGQADIKSLQTFPQQSFRLGAVGKLIATLKREGVRDLLLIGGIRRPSLLELRPDWRTARFFAKVGIAALGDDGLLKAIRKEFENEGFTLIGPQDIAAELLAPAGVLGCHQPDAEAKADIIRGIAVLRALAPVDVGQAAVIQQGLVLGIEAIEGTAELMRRTAAHKRNGAGGVLIKMAKPQQDKQLDLPTIGPDTVAQAAAAGLRGIAIEAGRTLIVDLAATIAAADKVSIFITAVEINK